MFVLVDPLPPPGSPGPASSFSVISSDASSAPLVPPLLGDSEQVETTLGSGYRANPNDFPLYVGAALGHVGGTSELFGHLLLGWLHKDLQHDNSSHGQFVVLVLFRAAKLDGK